MKSKIKELGLFTLAVLLIGLGGRIWHNHHYISLAFSFIGILILAYYWDYNRN